MDPPLGLETSETLVFSCNVFLRKDGTLERPLLLKQRKERATVGQYTSIVVSQPTLNTALCTNMSQNMLAKISFGPVTVELYSSAIDG